MKMHMTADNRGMPHLNELTDENLISQAHRLRLQALQGSVWAGALAYDHEVELRGRLRQSTDRAAPLSAMSKAVRISTAADRVGTVPQLKARATVVTSSYDATAGGASNPMTEVISTLLSNLRKLLGMD
jgi:hypothetical protein